MNVVMDLGLQAGNQQYQEQLYPLDIQDFHGAYAVGWIHKSHPLSPAEQEILELLKGDNKTFHPKHRSAKVPNPNYPVTHR